MTAFYEARVAVSLMFDVINRKPLIDGFSEEGQRPSITDDVSGHIEFRNVQFAYPSRPQNIVCRGYNLSLKAGESTALVGASGCGKVK